MEVYNLNRLHIQYVRCLTACVLADIEFTPHLLDPKRVGHEYSRVCDRLAAISEELASFTEGINLNSGKQLAKFLYETLGFEQLRRKGEVVTTDGGAPSTSQDTIKSLVAKTKQQHRFVELYVEYNKLSEAKSKSLDFFKAVCDGHDSKFYGEFNQGVTVTHRLSSSGRPIQIGKKMKSAQLQNIPREYKKLFTAPEGWLVGEADGSQLEFRVAADLAHDKQAISDIENMVDVHQNTADSYTRNGVPTTRQEAKARTFSPLFGGWGSTRAEKAYRTFFVERYSGIAGMQEKWGYDVLAASDRGLRTRYGMVFYYPTCTINKWGRLSDSTIIANYTIQSLSTAEIIPIALIHFWHRIEDKPVELFSTVHDSIISWVREDFVEEYKELSKEAFTRDVDVFLQRVYNYQFVTPLGCGIKVGSHWGEGREAKYDWFPQKQEWVVR